MTDAPEEAMPAMSKQMARVDAFVTKWIPLVGLDDWRINVVCRKRIVSGRTLHGWSAAAQATSAWMYQRALITFARVEIRDMDDEELEQLVLHELMHLVLDEMERSKGKRDAQERTATVLAKAFARVKAA